MADLLVRGIDDTLVRALKARAGANGRSAQAELRAILAEALSPPPRKRTFAEVLASMPGTVSDEDIDVFARTQDSTPPPDVFD